MLKEIKLLGGWKMNNKLFMNVLNGNVFKLKTLNNFEMFPSDPLGSLDDFLFKNFIGHRGVFYG